MAETIWQIEKKKYSFRLGNIKEFSILSRHFFFYFLVIYFIGPFILSKDI